MNFSGKKLRSIRVSKEISQKQMADDCELNQSLISKYERGDILNPPHHAVKVMADYLNVDPNEFYGADFKHRKTKSSDETQRLDVHVYFHFDLDYINSK